MEYSFRQNSEVGLYMNNKLLNLKIIVLICHRSYPFSRMYHGVFPLDSCIVRSWTVLNKNVYRDPRFLEYSSFLDGTGTSGDRDECAYRRTTSAASSFCSFEDQRQGRSRPCTVVATKFEKYGHFRHASSVMLPAFAPRDFLD